MASTRQERRRDGSIAYRVLYRHNGKQRSETFNTPEGQRRFLHNINTLGVEAALNILNTYDNTHPDMPTLGDYLHHHINALSGITPGTRHDYQTYATEIANTPLGQLPLDAITEAAVAKWIADQEGHRAAKTIKNRHALISAALSRAVREQLIPVNYARGAKIAHTIRDEMVILTPDEFARILDVATPHYRPFLMFLYGTGARFGEVTALKVGDIRTTEDPPTVSIVRAWKHTGQSARVVGPPKTRKGRRTVSLPRQLVHELDLDRPADDWLFLNVDGRVVRKDTFWSMWRRWVEKSGIGKRPRVHDLRHSHASYMIGRGMNLLDLQHRLGHEDISTTAGTYGHLLPEAQVQAARMAENMFPDRPQLSGS